MNKEMMEAFIAYLQSYYGSGGQAKVPTLQPNVPAMPLFQDRETGWEPVQPEGFGEELGLGNQMNQMFGGGYDDPTRTMN